MLTLATLGPVHHPDASERSTIRDNLRALARDAGDAELLCAAIVGVA